jgi:hypothetical protein
VQNLGFEALAGEAELEQLGFARGVVDGEFDFEADFVGDDDFDSHGMCPICKTSPMEGRTAAKLGQNLAGGRLGRALPCVNWLRGLRLTQGQA